MSKQKFIFIISKMRRFVILLTLLQIIWSFSNVITNGDFSKPILSAFSPNCPTNWSCASITHVTHSYFPTQYAYLHSSSLTNSSWIAQALTLNQTGVYVMNFTFGYVVPVGTTISVLWNDVVQYIVYTNTSSHNQSFQIIIKQNVGVIKISVLNQQADIDDVSLVLQIPDPPPMITTTSVNEKIVNYGYLNLPKQVSRLTSVVLSAPISSFSGAKPFFSFLSDLWMFSYSKHNFKGLINDIFVTNNQLQKIKIEAIETFTNFSISIPELSDYANFTDEKIIENNNSSAIFLQSALSFFVFLVPQNIAICFLFYVLFLVTKGRCFKVQSFLKPYYFLKEIIIFSILDQNISFLTLLCFGNFEISFSFTFLDKLALVFTVLMLFCFMLYTAVFFLLLSRLRVRSTECFTNGIIPCFSGYFLLATEQTLGSFFRGAAFFVFKDQFATQMAVTGCIQIIIVILTVYANSKRKRSIFRYKTTFCLFIVYRVLFSALHFVFIAENIFEESQDLSDLENITLQLEAIIIYLITFTTLMSFLFDIMPSSYLKTNKNRKNVKKNNQHNNISNLKKMGVVNYQQENQEKANQEKANQEKQIKGKIIHLKMKNKQKIEKALIQQSALQQHPQKLFEKKKHQVLQKIQFPKQQNNKRKGKSDEVNIKKGGH